MVEKGIGASVSSIDLHHWLQLQTGSKTSVAMTSSPSTHSNKNWLPSPKFMITGKNFFTMIKFYYSQD